jgi:hypothetical protein
MSKLLKAVLSITALTIVFLIGSPTWAEEYGYPIDDAFVATVVGTPHDLQAELPKIPLKLRSIEIFEDREVPEVFFYDRKMRYSYAKQKKSAPLIFLIAGTGSSYLSKSVQLLAKVFYQAGFHIVTISSPTHPNFVVAASETGVPGDAKGDAKDLYRVMQKIRGAIGKKMDVTDYYVSGYSLGGFNAAFVSWIDETEQAFNFKKALLINPPVSLYSSVSLLDRMLENIPGGEDNFNLFYDRLVNALTQAYKRSDGLQMDEDFLYKAYTVYKPPDELLAALIGTSFRMSAASMVFTSDVINNYGFIKPRNVTLTKNTNLDVYELVAMRLGFTDYFHAYFYPWHKERDPSITRASLIEKTSLKDIEDYLRTSTKIFVMHNQNDLILEDGEIDFVRDVFGDRAKIYPVGGHLGNMPYKDNTAHMVSVMKE